MLKFLLMIVFSVYSAQATERAVSAVERLDLLKNCYNHNKEFRADIPVQELCLHYTRDKRFIENSIQGRANEVALREELRLLNDFVEKRFSQSMSFIDYATVGYYWAKILDYSLFLKKKEPEEINKSMEIYRGIFLRTQKELGNKGGLQCADKPISQLLALPLVHVSKKGLVPFPELNEGLGFFDAHRLPRLALFFGVGADQELSYDGFLEVDSVDLFTHDQFHAQYALKNILQFMKWSEVAFSQSIANIAFLQEEMKKTLSQNEYRYAQMAFFKYFHEGVFNEILPSLVNFSFEMKRFSHLLASPKLMEAETLLMFGRNYGRRTREVIGLAEYFGCDLSVSDDLAERLRKIDSQIHNGSFQKNIFYLNGVYDLTENLSYYPKQALSQQDITEAALYVQATRFLYEGYKILDRFAYSYDKAH